MNPIPLAHGGSGVLDELLACGITLAVGLIIFFVSSLRRSQDEVTAAVETSENEHEVG